MVKCSGNIVPRHVSLTAEGTAGMCSPFVIYLEAHIDQLLLQQLFLTGQSIACEKRSMTNIYGAEAV
jgi:hypothetical protein